MTDQQALSQFAQRNDAEAFCLLVNQYQRLVYSAARRRLAHAQDIEDVVQLTFLKLARSASTIQRDLASWLYSTTINAANDLIRRDQTRLRHEALWKAHKDAEGAEAMTSRASHDEIEKEEWQRLGLLVDQAILQLPTAEQTLIVEHFLQNRSQRDLAAELHVSQPTIQRRLTAAVDALRQQLAALGGTSATALLPNTLQQLASSGTPALPAPLTAQLAKIGLAGAGGSGKAAIPLSAQSVGMKIAIGTAAALVVGSAGYLTATHLQNSPAPPLPPALAAVAPAMPATAPTRGSATTTMANARVRQVIPLTRLDAAKLLDALRPLLSADATVEADIKTNSLIITDTFARIRRVTGAVVAIDAVHFGQDDSPARVEYQRLTIINAADAARLINALFNPQTALRGKGDPQPVATQTLFANSDARTNTVVLMGPEPETLDSVGILRRLDRDDTPPPNPPVTK